jgi:hypothetical protein
MSKMSRRSSRGRRFVLSVAASASALAPACADVHSATLEPAQRAAGSGAPLDPRIDAGHVVGLVTLPVGTMVPPPVIQGSMVAPPSAGAPAVGIVVGLFIPAGPWAGTTVCPPEVCPIVDGGADD